MRYISLLLCTFLLYGVVLFATPQTSTTDEMRIVLRPIRILELPLSLECRKKIKIPLPTGGKTADFIPASTYEIYGRNTQGGNAMYAVRATGVNQECFRSTMKDSRGKWREEPQPDGSVRILFPDDDENYFLYIHPQQGTMLFVHKDLKDNVTDIFKDSLTGNGFQQNAAIAGTVRLPRHYRQTHSLLKNVETIDFYIAPGKNSKGETRITGKVSFYATSEAINQQIFKNTMQFFSEVYSNAATRGQLRPDHLEAFRVTLEKGKTTVVLSLSQQIAEDFITLFSAQMQDSPLQKERTLP